MWNNPNPASRFVRYWNYGKHTLSNTLLKSTISFLLFSSVFISAYSQPNFETSLPSGYKAIKGALSISDRHYRLGAQSLRWDWVGGDTLRIDLTAAQSTAINNGLFDWRNGHFEVWVHNEAASKDTFEVKFLNSVGVDQYRFRFNVNFSGWRRLLHSYTYDMLQRTSKKDVARTIYFIAPKTGSGTAYLDNMQYMRSYDFKQSDDVMPDLYDLATTRNYILSDVYYKSYYAPSLSTGAPTAAELVAVDSVRARARRAAIGVAPTATELSTANTKYATYNIQFTGTVIKGKIITDPKDIGDMISTFARNYVYTNNTDSKTKAINLLKLMLDCGIAGGSDTWFAGGHLGYNQMKFFTGLINVDAFADSSLRYELWHWIKWCTNTGLGWRSDSNGLFDTDDIYTLQDAYFCMILFADKNTAVQDLRRMKAYLEKFLQDQKGTSDGIKVDGTAFHHDTHYNAYMYAMGNLATVILARLRNTPFQINSTAYYNLRKAAYAEAIMANTIYYANSLNGRHPFEVNTYYTEQTMAQLSYIGGEVIGQTYDPIMSGIHSRMYGYAAKVGGVGAEPFPSGFWQMNYSPLAMYRRDNWAACIKGINNDFWATETYETDNRYGRYQGYGTLEVLYPSVWPYKLTPSGMTTTGWDWNKVPGTTSIVYPFDSLNLSATISTLNERSLLNFAGGVKFGTPSQTSPSDVILKDFQGDYGMFGINFQQSNLSITHSSTFVFRKSYFCFGKNIVCVGSNINNNRTWRNTITTLFQTTLAAASTPITVDASTNATFPFSQSLASTSGAHWMIDPFGTGYYVLSGNTIQIEKKSQTSPDESGSGVTTTANYANAYIDHGKAPVNGKYAYVVMPKTTSALMTDFSSRMGSASTRLFDILQQDQYAHIVRENATGVTGFSLFNANTNITTNTMVKGNNVPCVAMVQVKNDTMRISLVNPDINLVNDVSVAVPITLTLYGNWSKASNVAAKYASLVSSTADSTLVTFTAADGRAAEITLTRVAAKSARSASLSGEADDAANQNVLTLQLKNPENGTYYLEHKSATDTAWTAIKDASILGADEKQSHAYYDGNPLPDMNLYRVKWRTTNNDGWEYSNIVQLKNTDPLHLAVAPNPAVNSFSVMLKEIPSQALKWTLTDAAGKTVKAGTISGVNQKISVQEFPAGVYYLNIDRGRSFRIVVMR
ncbi:MAG: chondroitinase family polysaccharide lyase [Agriterribacter sp.]